MLGYREWDWRILWTQSDVPAPAGTISVDWIPEAPSLLKRLPLTQQLRQPRDIRRNPSRLVPREQFRRRSPTRLILEIDVGELLAGAVPHDEGGTNILDGPRGREAAGG
jgi:hypothetical protein